MATALRDKPPRISSDAGTDKKDSLDGQESDILQVPAATAAGQNKDPPTMCLAVAAVACVFDMVHHSAATVIAAVTCLINPMTKSPDDWFASLPPEHGPLLNSLRDLVRTANPEFVEAIKWGQPCYSAHSLVCYLNKFKSHVVLGFQMGAHLPDPQSLLEGNGKEMRHIKIRSMEDINNVAFRALINEAVRFDRESAR
jgi:hypothetical protein